MTFLFKEIPEPEFCNIIEVVIKYKHPNCTTIEEIVFSADNWKVKLNDFLTKFEKVKNEVKIMNNKKTKVFPNVFPIPIEGYEELVDFAIPLQKQSGEYENIFAPMKIQSIYKYDEKGARSKIEVTTMAEKISSF